MPQAAHASAPLPFDLGRIGAGLTFAEALPALESTIAVPGAAAVVQAPPGTGKTTLVPPAVANAVARAAVAEAGPRRVVVTQPRRVAARAAARRLAQLTGTRLGDLVGYAVRGERRAGPDTRVEFVTPGLLLRRLLKDPGLDAVAAVVVDEVHERALDTDLLLGLLGEVRMLREDLTLVAMSATVDAPRFAALLGDGGADDDGPAGPGGVPAPVVDCPSALHPRQTRWAPPPGPRTDERGVTREFLEHVARTAVEEHTRALATDPGVDALVFVPGAREVDAVVRRARELVAGAGAAVEVMPLHGRIPAEEQDRAVSGRDPGGPARIVVSTSLAESSLTVPGVRLVVDSGLAREPRRDAARGMTGLVTVQASRASCEQRAGRSARQGPGTVVRCFDEKSFAAASAHVTPEIASSDLTGAALVLACWGSPGGEGLRLPDAPPPAAMTDAVRVLRGLGAVDDAGHATPLGRRLAEVPADPRLARALYDGAAVLGARAAAEIVALLAGDTRAPGADLPRLLDRMERDGRTAEAQRWRQETRRLETLTGTGTGADDSGAAADLPAGWRVDRHDRAGFVVALAHPEWVARRVGQTGTYQFASGTRAALPGDSALAGHEWLAVAEVSRAEGRAAAGTGAVIRSAAPSGLEVAEAAAGHLLTDRIEAEFHADGRIRARRQRRLGAIVLSSTPVAPQPAEARAAVERALEAQGLGVIGFSASAEALRRRLALLHRELGAPWPDVSETALLGRLEEWLAPEIDRLASGTPAGRVDLTDPLRRLLPWPAAARFDELAPERLEVPSGSRIRIEYPDPGDGSGRPVVAVKLQECFGWAETPRLADGRVPVLFHLLSPAGRPLAVTDDLASFWAGPYAQVRAEMRGRYPKHPWPEDPWTAPATARTKHRR
ncbi:ATP-dependent helicase HrpB [Zhihengliuella sp.]|uniref:ATP-dependent helicase HrpB n=1 Tax=Zhihengliuella sp. TaxID=1954483 RepID=UPI0028125995|nr:ATP-dependent helicase HrpB [Zhihengliuella sp.]